MGIRNRQRHQSRRTRIFEKRRRSRPRSTSKFNGLTDSLSIPRNHKHTNTHTETCPQTKVPFCRNARVFRISQRVFRFGKFNEELPHFVIVNYHRSSRRRVHIFTRNHQRSHRRTPIENSSAFTHYTLLVCFAKSLKITGNFIVAYAKCSQSHTVEVGWSWAILNVDVT